MTILNRNDQGGRSMVEMLGVLAIIGVLSVGGISGYSKAMAKFKLTKAQDQITMLLMNIRTAYATSPSYAGLNSKAAIEYNLAPQEMAASTSGTGTLYGAFGGAVDVTSVGTNNTYFRITLHSLGKEACRSLATSDWGADGLVEMIVGNDTDGAQTGTVAIPCTTGGTASGRFCTAELPVSLANAATHCNHETSYITWIYY